MNHFIISPQQRTSKLAVLILVFICGLSNAGFAQNPLYIDPNGNVGIGTNKPLYRLHTMGNTQIDGNLNVNGLLFLNKTAPAVANSQGTYFLWNRSCVTNGPCFGETNIINHAGGGEGGFRFENTKNGTDITSLMTLSGSGMLGIGTQPAHRLTLGGNGSVFGVDNSAFFVVKNPSGNYEPYLWPRWSDNATYLNYGPGGFYIRNNASAPALFMTNDIRLGIGNTGPYGTLDVSGDIYTSIHGNPGYEHDGSNRGSRRIGMSLNADFTGMELVTEAWDCGNGGLIKFLTWGCNASVTREVMRINENARVGINSTNPTAPLTVGNTVSNGYAIQDQVTQVAYQWNAHGDNNPIFNLTNRSGNWCGFDLSIYAAGGIMGRALYAFSDARIKKNIQVSNPATALTLLNKLRVTDYQYKDQVANGTRVSKGFIAQEVEQVFPEAVSQREDFLPDIFTKPVNATVSGSTLKVTLKAPHHLVSGDQVRLMLQEAGAKDVKIAVVDSTSFTVDDWSGSVKDLFVYGKQVTDFRTIDYQQIFALGISGIQALSKEVTALQNENVKLNQENAANRKQLLDMQVRLLALEKQQELRKSGKLASAQ
ncbi:tail fiber domain-containing protein [Chitinophaga nivalis]|uniref:Tail fiber domain-containing protein n=1 Tax=Chitinophaga nivalis TaxID=2991709 RepID=A0ABT3IJN7_9BACT|nr:tail fiber domain-containing protein [Chitinophaga nivalis]MCW3466155.1 tail fiber domain-containing protein [Chitinophaga nivalis]MCW3484154.1 tail fiber domain-containing protein [Chitinophaga nivalis]